MMAGVEASSPADRSDAASAGHDDHRADALFVLPELPRRVAVVGDLPEWRGGLAARGIELVEPGAGAQVVVASEGRLDAALRAGAETVAVDGSRAAGARLGAAGLAVRRLLPLPLHGSPSLYADLSSGTAVRYAFHQGIAHAQLWRTLRNSLVGTLAAAGFAAPFPRLISLGLRDGRPPAFVAAAQELGIPPSEGWAMVVSPGPAVRRNALLLFPHRERAPAIAIKYSRIRGMTEPFERERRGYGAFAGLEVVGSRAPRRVGEIEVDGYPAAVQSAAAGARLSSLLRQARRTAVKLEVVDAVAQWLVNVGRRTALPPDALATRREVLRRELERSPFAGRVPASTFDRLARVPASFQHNDLGADNVVADGSQFTVLDWEWAERAGFPFGDLVMFAARTLAILDGSTQEGDPGSYFTSLLRGEASSSPLLFRWVRALAGALGAPTEAVGPGVGASLLRSALVSLRERERAERAVGRALEPDFQVRVAERWLEEPGLGDDWRVWRA
jgi:hypothetical protein